MAVMAGRGGACLGEGATLFVAVAAVRSLRGPWFLVQPVSNSASVDIYFSRKYLRVYTSHSPGSERGTVGGRLFGECLRRFALSGEEASKLYSLHATPRPKW